MTMITRLRANNECLDVFINDEKVMTVFGLSLNNLIYCESLLMHHGWSDVLFFMACDAERLNNHMAASRFKQAMINSSLDYLVVGANNMIEAEHNGWMYQGDVSTLDRAKHLHGQPEHYTKLYDCFNYVSPIDADAINKSL